MNNINNSSRKGYALSVLLIALLVISLGIVALIPVLSMKKDTFTNTSYYVKNCIVKEGAASLTSTACTGAVTGLTKGFNKDYESVLYYLNDATYKNTALKVVKASCDQDGRRACNILLDRCAATSDAFQSGTCNIDTKNYYQADNVTVDSTDIGYDLNHYITMKSSDTNPGYLGKDYIKTKGVEYYLQGMPNFKNAVDAACNADMASTACDIAGETKTRIYNFNSPQRSEFFESNPTNGTNFHDGIVDLYPGIRNVAYCWGKNGNGQLGDNTTTDRWIPTLVSDSIEGPVSYSDITASIAVSCGIANYSAYCWGRNEFGGIGDNTTIDKKIPTRVSNAIPDSFIYYNQISSQAWGHTCARGFGTTIYCWGNNASGELGDNTTVQRLRSAPIKYPIEGPTSYSQVSVGACYACALTTADFTQAGKAYCWGNNFYGGIGDNTATDRKIPKVVSDPIEGHVTYSQISAGYNTCALTTADFTQAGKAYCWGYNSYGQIGDNTTTNRRIPTLVKDPIGGPVTFSQISVDYTQSCGLTTAGKAYCWGRNNYGEIGDNTTTTRKIPTAVSDPIGGPVTYSQIESGSENTCGLTTTGKVYCWGRNNYGQLGDNTTTDRWIPTLMSDPIGGPVTFSKISGSAYNYCGLANNPSIYLFNKAYLITTDNNNITGIIGGIKSFIVTSTEPANTKIRGLVSFDGRNSWKRCANCDNPTTRTWVTVTSGCNPTTNSCLNNNLFSVSGNTITQMQQELTNLKISTITGQTGKLDFAFYMETDTTGVITPFIDAVSITFLKGR